MKGRLNCSSNGRIATTLKWFASFAQLSGFIRTGHCRAVSMPSSRMAISSQRCRQSSETPKPFAL